MNYPVYWQFATENRPAMSDDKTFNTSQSIAETLVSLFGFLFLLYFSMGFLHTTKGVVTELVSEQEGYQFRYWMVNWGVSLLGVLLSTVIIYKSNQLTRLLTSYEEVPIELSSPVLFLRISLILFSVLVLFSCLPSVIMSFFGLDKSSMNSVPTIIFWSFESSDFLANVIRSILAVLVLVFNRQIASWSLEK